MSIPTHANQLGDARLEQRVAVQVDGLAFLGADGVGVDALAGHAAGFGKGRIILPARLGPEQFEGAGWGFGARAVFQPQQGLGHQFRLWQCLNRDAVEEIQFMRFPFDKSRNGEGLFRLEGGPLSAAAKHWSLGITLQNRRDFLALGDLA